MPTNGLGARRPLASTQAVKLHVEMNDAELDVKRFVENRQNLRHERVVETRTTRRFRQRCHRRWCAHVDFLSEDYAQKTVNGTHEGLSVRFPFSTPQSRSSIWSELRKIPHA